MAEEIIISGKTVEEAMTAAAAKYSGENVSYEILEMPKKGFLGIGSSPAKIKVTISSDDDDEIDLKGIVSQVKDMKIATNRGGSGTKEREYKKEKNDRDTKPSNAEKSESDGKALKEEHQKKQPRYDRAASEKKSEKTKENRTFEKEAKASGGNPDENSTVTKSEIKKFSEKAPRAEVTEEEKQYALEFTRTLLKNMGINAGADFAGTEEAFDGTVAYPRIEISGEGAGILIGHHGETLDAIQYLVNLTALRRGGSAQKEFVKIVVDIENYRSKREETLRSLAKRMAFKAVKYRRNVVLEPMNPYERRIIHSEIQEIENVSTHSVGSDENRKIIVTYEGPDKADRPYGKGRSEGYRGSRSNRKNSSEE